MGMRIEQTTDYPYELLLLADPNREYVDDYLKTSDCFIAIEGNKVFGVVVVQKQTATMAEVLNLAVDESFQRKGIARRLLRFISDEWAEKNQVELLKVCTGTSAPGPLMLYQQEGFDLKELDRDYFVRNYPEPIWENGLQCRHQLILEKELKRLIDIK
nr:GNAT family N-acetyltransferase [Parabacteroides goldsteinii]